MLLNGNEYKTILLDTNVLREILSMKQDKEEDKVRKKKSCENLLMRHIVDEKYVFLISYVSFAEIYPYKDIYERFLELFNLVPFFLVFGNEQIVVEEYKCSDNNIKLKLGDESNTILYSVDQISNPIVNLDRMFKQHETQGTFDIMINELEEVRIAWENQRVKPVKNIYKMETYLKNEKQAVNIVASSYLKKPLPFKRFRVEDYPSIRLVQYCQFKKVHHTKKSITMNDVMDIKLCGIVPYVDKVITERQQASFFTEARNIIPELKKIEFTTLKDIRK